LQHFFQEKTVVFEVISKVIQKNIEKSWRHTLKEWAERKTQVLQQHTVNFAAIASGNTDHHTSVGRNFPEKSFAQLCR
jgi:DNA-binding FadR family transcriptional regulator